MDTGFNLFEATQTLMMKHELFKLISSTALKLPTKTSLAKALNTTVYKLELKSSSVEDLLIHELQNFEKETQNIFKLCQQTKGKESLETQIQYILQNIISMVLQQPAISHLLSGNNLYKLSSIQDLTSQITISTYMSLRGLLQRHIKNQAYNIALSQLIIDCLTGIYLNISRNVDLSTQTLETDIFTEIKIFVTLFKLNK